MGVAVNNRWRPMVVTLRVLGAVFGAYAFTSVMVALAAMILWRGFDMPRGEASLAAAMGGFLLFLVTLLWAFAERRLWQVWAILFGGAATGYALVRSLGANG